MVVADISGSVAAFARFTLHLVYAISGQFSKVRSFVFIDGLDEVPAFSREWRTLGGRASSQYRGRCGLGRGALRLRPRLRGVRGEVGKEVGPKTTVLILGDARNNYHASQSWIVKELKHRARKVFWLNPEPKAYWDTGDSIVGEYGTLGRGRARGAQPPPTRGLCGEVGLTWAPGPLGLVGAVRSNSATRKAGPRFGYR
ncbi:MAG: hypothetical protein CM1200mP26_20490 [Acidimicrobiales bacterium]|nr:MAG: hypothetical protein CM1200mP26_20490 [Acidimicrobiales bacterium]